MARKNKFVSWVFSHKKPHSEKNDYNFVSAKGGKFKITDSNKFFALLHKNYVKLSQKNAFPLIFRGPRDTKTPFYLDIDLQLKTDESIPSSVFIEIVHQFLVKLKSVTGGDAVWKVIISRRTGSYWSH